MPNGVDAELFAPGADDEAGLRAALGIADDAVVARSWRPSIAPTTSSGWTSRSPRSPARREAVHLVVAGGGELLDDFRAQATRPGIGDRVHFLGAVPHPELPDVLRAADLFLLTTEPPESFGIVLIEAMACGLATIVTEYPGVRRWSTTARPGLVTGRRRGADAAASTTSAARPPGGPAWARRAREG